MAFGLEVVMLIKFQVQTLRVQISKRLDKEQSEQIRKEQLMVLEESRLQAMCAETKTNKGKQRNSWAGNENKRKRCLKSASQC